MDVYNVMLWAMTVALWVLPGGGDGDCMEGNEATTNLRDVVIGTCELYQAAHQQFFCPDNFRNCSDTWEAFSEAFRYQPPCEISEERYERYVNLTATHVPRDKALFWENVYPFVMRFSHSGVRYYTVSDLLLGAIGDKPVWCGSEDAPGFGSTCPPWEPSATCRQHAQRAFWIAASHRYAGSAVGQIHVMLNASITPIYSNDSYFSLFEVPYIRPGFVDKVTVLLVNENPQAGRSKCEEESLEILESLFRQKNITFECEENRRYTNILEIPRVKTTKFGKETVPLPTKGFNIDTRPAHEALGGVFCQRVDYKQSAQSMCETLWAC
ncbi:ADP-ribosyl cyclase/cyclic ADP-ribose hydrolase-like isoform X2 [Mya arenaria]|uniref:ADP-ribosyl cyclase/cyclic ADP-ribose hydrolase-like isoform X2 n=1 Tax=Mya arenaria TaxID=6604 RepID=UPI0022E3EFE8|nr:ADP-ribosyl cyclase/cyclic ADP-ribose hydrolase-like isoform X2 [Mya arenaria]